MATKAVLTATLANDFPDNTTGLITPALFRNFQNLILDTLNNIEIPDAWTGITSGIALQYRGVKNLAGTYIGFDLTGTTPIGNAVSSTVTLFSGDVASAMPAAGGYSFVVPVHMGTGTTTPSKVTVGGTLLSAGVTLYRSGSAVNLVATKIGQANSTTLITPSVYYLYDFSCLKIRFRTVNNGTAQA